MAETLNTGFDPSHRVSDDKDFAEETKSGEFDLPALEANFDGYVALDVANLSLLASAAGGEVDFASGHRPPLKKTLSRKGSQRGGERKAADSTTAVSAAGADRSASLEHVAGEGEEGTLRLATTPTAGAFGGGGRCRRVAFRRPSPWLDPRRVLVLFATLSSVGTLILLYFTLFMGSFPGGDGNVR